MTLKGHRILQNADFLAYPCAEEGESLARAIAAPHIPADIEEYPIRMPILTGPFPVREVYDRAAQRIGQVVAAQRTAVVLCEGDPFFYGSFMYLFARLSERYPVEVVPGVSSLMACAAALSAPLAARDDILIVLPAPVDDAVLEERLAGADSAAIVKVGRHLPRVAALLDRIGLAERACYVEHATMASERVMPLSSVREAEAPYFSMILVHRRGRAWR